MNNWQKTLHWFGFGSQDHSRKHGDDHAHGHSHGVIDPTIATTDQGIWAIKWSAIILLVTAALQIAVVILSGSVALLADTIHNLADATTAIPLWIAFILVRRKPTATFTYGLGRVEDLAGISIVLIILFSALFAGYAAFDRLLHPQAIHYLGWLTLAGFLSFIGNEIVAVLRIRVGRKINSAALIADGYHARTDGLTSLAVVIGAAGVWFGYPLADPIVGLIISFTILAIVWQSARSVLMRMLDGVESGITAEIHHAAEHVTGIEKVLDAKARWLGHLLHIDVTIAVDDGLLLATANDIAESLKNKLFHHIPGLAVANVRFGKEAVTHNERHGHHHAPQPFRVDCKLASGLLEIVNTPMGERMRLRVSRHAEGLKASVAIARSSGKIETLTLAPVSGDHHHLESAAAPEEPHVFSATLNLKAGKLVEELPFAMAEPS